MQNAECALLSDAVHIMRAVHKEKGCGAPDLPACAIFASI